MRRRLTATGTTLLVLVSVVIGACSPADVTDSTSTSTIPTTTTTQRPLPTTGPPQPDMAITSPAFEEGRSIPVRHTCDGADRSPELLVSDPPPGTMSLAIIVDDPDAPVGVWDHWVEYDIEPSGEPWPEAAGRLGVQGVNSWNLPGYGGPCPPQGETHRYYFTVYALDTELSIPAGVDSGELRAAMEGHILAEAQLMGTFSR